MATFILSRLIQLPFLLLIVSAIVFVILRLGPASPVDVVAEAARDPADVERIRQEWGLDRPIYVQYADYIFHAVQGDFGRSLFSNKPVAEVIAERFPATLELAFLGMVLGSIFGIALGLLSAFKSNSLLDALLQPVALAGISLPGFWLGLMFIAIFAVNLGWLPVGGRFDVRMPIETVTRFYSIDAFLSGNLTAVWIALKHLTLPAVVLGLAVGGFIARITRSMVIDSMRQDYIRTARGKGLSDSRVVMDHALRNALLPIVTIMGLQFGILLGGTAVIETVFSWPGLGKLLVDSINTHDFPQVQASIMVLATTYIIVNLVVDLLYGFIDPRIRYGKS